MSSPIAIGALVLVLALVAYKVLRGGLDGAKFVIVVGDDGQIEVKGEVPGVGEGAARDFVAGLELPAGARIWGVPDRDRITLKFSSSVPENLQQRMRNFFYNAM